MISLSLSRNCIYHYLLLLAVFSLTGCVTPSHVASNGPFYPEGPAPPRLQYLLSLTTSEDLAGESITFKDILLGRPKGLSKPSAVVFTPGRILVADSQQQGYVVFDLAKKEMSLISGQGMRTPCSLKVAADGTRYIVDSGAHEVIAFDQNENRLQRFGLEENFRPFEVMVDGDRLIVTNIARHTLSFFDRKTGEFLGDIDSKTQLMWPGAMAKAPDGSLLVVDGGHFRVVRLNSEGIVLATYGAAGDRMGSFARPRGLAIDRAGRIYIGDGAFQNVQIYDLDGRYLMFFGGKLINPDDKEKDQATMKVDRSDRSILGGPAGITIDYDSVPFFQRYAAPGFQLEYVVAVADQILGKINIYGFGRMDGRSYDDSLQQ